MALKLNEKQRKALSDYLVILHQNYKEEILKVILFGSVARGELDSESDIDLLVVTKSSDQKFKDEISMACFDVIIDTEIILSPLVMDKGIYEWHKKYHDPLYNNIQKDGIDLWIKGVEFL